MSESVRIVKDKPKYTESGKIEKKTAGSLRMGEPDFRKSGHPLSTADRLGPQAFAGSTAHGKKPERLQAGRNMAAIKKEFASLHQEAKNHFDELPFEQLSSRVQLLHVESDSAEFVLGGD